MGSVETLICWENLDIQRYVLKNHANSLTTTVLHLTPEQEKDKSHFTDKEVSLKYDRRTHQSRSKSPSFQLLTKYKITITITIFHFDFRAASKWNWWRHNRFWNGWPTIIRILVLHSKLLPINHKRAVNLCEDSVALVVSIIPHIG